MSGRQEPRPNFLVTCSSKLQEALEQGFGKIGNVIGRHPWKIMLVCIVIPAALSAGITQQKSESRTEKLWVPQGSQSLEEQEWVRNTFGFGGRTGYLLARPKDSSDALKTSVLLALLEAHQILNRTRAASAEYTTRFPNTYSYQFDDTSANPPVESICERRGTLCYTSTIFDVLGTYDATTLSAMTRTQMLSKLNTPSNYGVSDAFRVVYNVTASDLFGGISRDANGQITGVKIVRSVYRMTRATISVNSEFVDPSREAWELKADKDISAGSYGDTDLVAFFDQTFSTEFGNAIGGDIALFAIGYMLLIFYMAVAMGKRDYVHSMLGMALVAVLVVGLSIGGSYGIAGLLGIISTPLTSSLPFLILGLGVDDAFIIAGEFQAVGIAHPEYDVVERMQETLKHAGVSILITSVTDITAFFIGASTILPALSAFCSYAALGVIFVFVLNVTVFSAALVIDAQRTKANRADCCCCFKLDTPHEIAPPIGQELPYMCCLHKIPQNATRMFCKWLGQRLVMIPSRIAVVLVSLGILAFAIVGATRLTNDFKLQWFLPDDSPLQKYYAWNDEFFVNDLPVFGYTRKLDYTSTAVQSQMNSLHTLFTSAPYLNGLVFDWHYSFTQWASSNNVTLSQSNYYTSLSGYLQGPGRSVSGFVAWADDANPSAGINGAFVFGAFQSQKITNADNQVRVMLDIRSDMTKIFPSTNDGFAFTFPFAFWEQYVVIAEEMWRNIGLAVAAVFVIATLLIPRVTASLLVLFTVCLTIADLLGLMYWWGLTIDGVTVVYLVIAIGLSVDYSAHIGEGFMLSKEKTREARVIDTMYRMGASVFNGAFSTFLAVVVMAFARTYIFRVFFQQFFLVTLFGSVHGLVLLPILLATCGPPPLHEHEGEEIADDTEQAIGLKEVVSADLNKPVELKTYDDDTGSL